MAFQSAAAGGGGGGGSDSVIIPEVASIDPEAGDYDSQVAEYTDYITRMIGNVFASESEFLERSIPVQRKTWGGEQGGGARQDLIKSLGGIIPKQSPKRTNVSTGAIKKESELMELAQAIRRGERIEGINIVKKQGVGIRTAPPTIDTARPEAGIVTHPFSGVLTDPTLTTSAVLPSTLTSLGAKGYGNDALVREIFGKKAPTPRKIFELANVEEQCINIIGGVYNPAQPANRQCYICGIGIYAEELQQHPDFVKTFPGRKEGRNQKGLVPECEHILPVAEASQFLYLYDNRWSDGQRGKIPQILYAKMILEYAWAHHCCNMIKNNLLFIRHNTTTNLFEIDFDTIGKVLTKIYTEGRSDSKIVPHILQNMYKGGVSEFIADRFRIDSQLVIRLTKLVNYLNKLTEGDAPGVKAALMFVLSDRLTKEAIANSIAVSLKPADRAQMLAYLEAKYNSTPNFPLDAIIESYIEKVRQADVTLAARTEAATAQTMAECPEGVVCRTTNRSPATFVRDPSLGRGNAPPSWASGVCADPAGCLPAATYSPNTSLHTSGAAVAAIGAKRGWPGYGGARRKSYRKRGLKKKGTTKRK